MINENEKYYYFSVKRKLELNALNDALCYQR